MKKSPERTIIHGRKKEHDETQSKSAGRGRIWLSTQDGFVKPLEIEFGATDGSVTEIIGNDIVEGLSVVVGEDELDEVARDRQMSNPFLPKFFSKKKTNSRD